MKVTNTNSVVAPVVTKAQPTAAEIERANQRATIVKVLKATLVAGVAASVAAVAYAFSAGKITPNDTTTPDVITPDTKPDTSVPAGETMWPLIGKVGVTVAGLVGFGLTANHYTPAKRAARALTAQKYEELLTKRSWNLVPRPKIDPARSNLTKTLINSRSISVTAPKAPTDVNPFSDIATPLFTPTTTAHIMMTVDGAATTDTIPSKRSAVRKNSL